MPTKLTLEDLAAVRQQSKPLTGNIAPTISSDFFKSEKSAGQTRSKDFSHYFSLETRLREPATLKAAGSNLTSGVVSLATGRPSPEYYPLFDISFGFVKVATRMKGEKKACKDSSSHKQQHCQEEDSSNALPVALSYGYSQGSEGNIRFLTEHTELVHDPPYANWEVCMTAGSTSAIENVLRMFCNRGDFILLEEYSYSGTLEAMKPLGIQSASIKMDSQGISAKDLEATLANWDSVERGAPKPFLLYTIPTGQNPTGITQTLQRRKEIYGVAERHNLFIIEDDPYFYLHYPLQTALRTSASPENNYLHTLPRSYLSMDLSGRVIRLESTSKLLAPGLRCGWLTCNSIIVAKLLSHHDVGIVCPSGLSQLMMEKLLEETWGHEGFVRWLMYLRDQYALRCETLVTACEKFLPREVCEWRRPEAGMFLWVKVAWEKHPQLSKSGREKALGRIEELIFSAALRRGLWSAKEALFGAVGQV